MEVINSISDCAVANPNNRNANYYASITYSIAHRTDLEHKAPGNGHPIPNSQLHGPQLAKAFRDPLLGTAGRIPYQGLIWYPNGEIEQILPLLCRGAHARGYNWCGLGWAIVGNTDERPCTPRQWESAIQVFSVLAVINAARSKIVGHTDLPGASGDPNKRCPGRYFNVDELRRAAMARMPTGCAHWSSSETVAWVATQGFRW